MIREGYIPFKGYQTYYRIAGEDTGKAPLILLHGGPGSTHNYFEVLDRLADTGREIIMYDQLGCGNSYLDGHPELWCAETWADELQTLITHLGIQEYHLLGQSWGGMLALYCLIEKKMTGIKSVILSSTLSSSALWAHEQHRLISMMSEEDRKATARAEKTGNFDDPACVQATDRYMKLHSADIQPDAPECLRREKRSGHEAYLTAWGPCEYFPTGTLKDFDVTQRLGEINIPALVISGTNDLCTPLVAKTLYDGIPQARWELFDGARHMVFAEQTEKYCALLRTWMAEND